MDAEQLIRSLGGTGNLRGFHYAVYMVGLIEQDPVNATNGEFLDILAAFLRRQKEF